MKLIGTFYILVLSKQLLLFDFNLFLLIFCNSMPQRLFNHAWTESYLNKKFKSTHDLNWMYIKRLYDVQNAMWTPYVHLVQVLCPLGHIWIVSTTIISNTCYVNNTKGKKPNTPLKSVELKKCRYYVTITDKKSLPSFVFS